jgi:hypothetical protein
MQLGFCMRRHSSSGRSGRVLSSLLVSCLMALSAVAVVVAG